MKRISLPVLGIAFGVGIAPIAVAAGGGGSAGGSGAQNSPGSGLPPGEPGPPGSANNPHRDKPSPKSTTSTPETKRN